MSVEIKAKSGQKNNPEKIQNIGAGGLCFISPKSIRKGTQLKINIPNLKKEFEENCIVIWCKKKGSRYEVGVKFLDEQTTFRMRMIEQICYIEHYRNEVLKKEGRELTPKEASAEWILKYADKFPKV
jgi:hypothetical protein